MQLNLRQLVHYAFTLSVNSMPTFSYMSIVDTQLGSNSILRSQAQRAQVPLSRESRQVQRTLLPHTDCGPKEAVRTISREHSGRAQKVAPRITGRS